MHHKFFKTFFNKIIKWFDFIMFTIFSNKLNSDKNPVVFIFKIHFLTLKLTF